MLPLISVILLLIYCCASPLLACQCGDAGPLPSTDPFDPLGPWHQRHLDCGIPPFAYRLPQDAQAKIHAIWVKYQPGDECEDEQNQTRVVIMSIPEEVRMQLFKGVCGPGFLKNESDDVKDRFRQVWFDESLTVDQKQQQFRTLAQELLKGETAKRFEQFDEKLSEHISERQQMLQQLSAKAKDAYDKWVGMRKQERSFLSGLPAEIRAELGLICKCCGTCETGQKNSTNTAPSKKASRAARSTVGQPPDAPNGDQLAQGLAQSDMNALVQSSGTECLY